MSAWRTTPCLGLVLLAAVLLQTIAVAVTFLYFTDVLAAMRETFSKSSVSCLMSANLRSLKGSDLSSERKDEPCWQVTQQLHSLIQKTMSSHYQDQISSKVKDEVSRVLPGLALESQDDDAGPAVAAHVTGSLPSAESKAERPYAKMFGQKIHWWEAQKGLAFLRNVNMSSGELMVQQAGLYYVYAQVYFRHSAEAAVARGEQMVQYIYKKVGSYPVPILLMKNAQTTCWAQNAQYGLYSIYQAGVFQLTPSDRIFVSVSNLSAVTLEEKSSFFGIFLIT